VITIITVTITVTITSVAVLVLLVALWFLTDGLKVMFSSISFVDN
jgi:hypothetical protein